MPPTMEDSYMSSPDPLANSRGPAPLTEGIVRRKSARLAPAKTPLRPTARAASRVPSEASTAQTVQLQNFVFDTPQRHQSRSSSPTKSSMKTENHLSPWRIRVTVEAERDDKNGGGDIGNPTTEADPVWEENKDSGSPSRGRATRRTRTTTTMVPVKGLESSPPAPKRRGRPKKSETPAKPRSGTPVPKTRGRRKAAGDVSGGGDGKNPEVLTPKRPRARSKKGHIAAEDNPGTVPNIERNEGAYEDTAVVASPFPIKSKTPARKYRAKKSASPVKIAIDQSIPADVPETGPTMQTQISAGHADGILGDVLTDHASSALVDLSVNSLAMAETAQPGDSATISCAGVRGRLGVPTGKPSPTKKTLAKSKQPEYAMGVGTTPTRVSSPNHFADQQPFESPVVKLGEELLVADDPGYATASEPPPADGYDLDYSVLESEGFSMVSVSSIPSIAGYMSSPTPQESHNDIECGLVQSLTGMNLQSPPTRNKSPQQHRNLTQEDIWQLERNAISQQIEMTDPNQVITIDSDNEPFASDEDGEPIDEESFIDPGMEYQMCRGRFLQDQERLLQKDCQHRSSLELQQSTNLDNLFSNEDAKPRRGRIPSPWRAERQAVHSDEVESGDDSGLLPPLAQEKGETGEGVRGRKTVPKGIEGPANLSQLLGLKSSPARESNGSKQNVEKSLRQRLIEKFYWAKQPEPQDEKPLEAKPMEEASGRLILYPSLPDTPDPEENIAPKYDGPPITGLWGMDGPETQGDRQRRRRRFENRSAQTVQEINGGSTPVEDVNVGRMLGGMTHGVSPPDGFASRDESLGSSSPIEQRPLVFKLLSDRPADAPSPTTRGLEPTTSSSALFPTTNPNPEPTPNQPAPRKTWTKDHWTLLNTLWLASKKTLRLHHERYPANPPKKTYTTGNLSFDCPGRRSLMLDDNEMDVVREFGLVMRRRLGADVDADADTTGLFGEGGEFGEKKVAKRMYSMIISDEDRRRRGEVYDEWGKWVGYGNSRRERVA
ncbi:MAG: hypothetical protein M1840_007744 [Geoglossum simile]|nr:MAG: hypothetical protein M1840_007744 [Geoglossum simile]